MGLFDKVKNKFKKKDKVFIVNVPVNKYFWGNDKFSYEHDFNDVKEIISLKICKKLELGDFSNLYECYMNYSYSNLDNIFSNVIIGLDKEKMVKDPSYTEFVFTKLLSSDRVRNICNLGDRKQHYVGSILEIKDRLIVLVDENINDVLEVSSGNKSIHELYGNENTSTTRREKIESLKEELEQLTSQEDEYQRARGNIHYN